VRPGHLHQMGPRRAGVAHRRPRPRDARRGSELREPRHARPAVRNPSGPPRARNLRPLSDRPPPDLSLLRARRHRVQPPGMERRNRPDGAGGMGVPDLSHPRRGAGARAGREMVAVRDLGPVPSAPGPLVGRGGRSPPRAEPQPKGAPRLFFVGWGHNAAVDQSRWSPGVNVGKPIELSDNCYLIKHGADWLLWDTGYPDAVAEKPITSPVGTATRTKTLAAQLAEVGVKPAE